MRCAKNDSEALYEAVICNRPDIVALLIPHSDPKSRNSEALCVACEENHTECAIVLLPVSDATVKDSLPLRWAVEHNNQIMIDLLYPKSDPVKALAHMKEDHPEDDPIWHPLAEKIDTARQKEVLLQEVHDAGGLSKSPPICYSATISMR